MLWQKRALAKACCCCCCCCCIFSVSFYTVGVAVTSLVFLFYFFVLFFLFYCLFILFLFYCFCFCSIVPSTVALDAIILQKWFFSWLRTQSTEVSRPCKQRLFAPVIGCLLLQT